MRSRVVANQPKDRRPGGVGQWRNQAGSKIFGGLRDSPTKGRDDDKYFSPITSYAQYARQWETDVCQSFQGFGIYTALIKSKPVSWKEGILLQVHGKTTDKKTHKAIKEVIEKQLTTHGKEKDRSAHMQKYLRKQSGDHLFIHDRELNMIESDKQDRARSVGWNVFKTSLLGSVHQGVWRSWDDFVKRDFARVFEYVVGKIAQSRWVSNGRKITECINFTFQPGQSIASFHAKKKAMEKELLSYHSELRFPPLMNLCTLLATAYEDPNLTTIVEKVERKLCKSEKARIE